MEASWQTAENEAVSDLSALLRFPTVNPPGDEGPAIEYIADRLTDVGLSPEVLTYRGRPNLVVRLEGDGNLPGGALLLTGHVDVVPVEPEAWTHPPFDAVEDGGYLFGRGAVDMKNMVAMCLTVVRQLAERKVELGRDVIFAAIADEEAGCVHGSRFLVAEHPDKVRAECMLGEFGAFSMDIRGKRFYPTQVAEKGRCRLKLTAVGDPGHGSLPHDNNAVVTLGRVLGALGETRLPQHQVGTVSRFIQAMARAQGPPARLILPRLLNPRLSGPLLKVALPKPIAQNFSVMLSNTVSPTMLEAGDAISVIPGHASAKLDGRLLPGQTDADLVREVQAVIAKSAKGARVDVEVLEHAQGRENPSEDHPLLNILVDTLKRHDASGVPVPYMLPGFTDASEFGKIIPHCFGFSPVRFPADDEINIAKLPHAHDERIHVEGYKWGLGVLWDAVRTHCTAK